MYFYRVGCITWKTSISLEKIYKAWEILIGYWSALHIFCWTREGFKKKWMREIHEVVDGPWKNSSGFSFCFGEFIYGILCVALWKKVCSYLEETERSPGYLKFEYSQLSVIFLWLSGFSSETVSSAGEWWPQFYLVAFWPLVPHHLFSSSFVQYFTNRHPMPLLSVILCPFSPFPLSMDIRVGARERF